MDAIIKANLSLFRMTFVCVNCTSQHKTIISSETFRPNIAIHLQYDDYDVNKPSKDIIFSLCNINFTYENNLGSWPYEKKRKIYFIIPMKNKNC